MKLSVAICTFNGEMFIKKQLDSILNQSCEVQEIIICDDGSNDNTRNILLDYKERFPNKIKLDFNTSSFGTIKNFEKAISLTTGDLIFLSDQDDIWLNEKVSIVREFFSLNVKCKLLFTNGELINENEQPLGSTLWEKWDFNSEIKKKWLNNEDAFKDLVNNKNKITGATVCFHKSLKNFIFPFILPYGYWHDAWLGLHASANNGLYFIDKSLIKYRIHQSQQVGVSRVLKEGVIEKSNSEPLEKQEFYKVLIKLYPDLNERLILKKKKSLFTLIKNLLFS